MSQLISTARWNRIMNLFDKVRDVINDEDGNLSQRIKHKLPLKVEYDTKDHCVRIYADTEIDALIVFGMAQSRHDVRAWHVRFDFTEGCIIVRS